MSGRLYDPKDDMRLFLAPLGFRPREEIHAARHPEHPSDDPIASIEIRDHLGPNAGTGLSVAVADSSYSQDEQVQREESAKVDP